MGTGFEPPAETTVLLLEPPPQPTLTALMATSNTAVTNIVLL
jgi:hypothetical protein